MTTEILCSSCRLLHKRSIQECPIDKFQRTIAVIDACAATGEHLRGKVIAIKLKTIYRWLSARLQQFNIWTNHGLVCSWWRHQVETFSALLAICAENSPVPGEFPTQRPVTRSFDVYFDLRPNKRLSKQSWGWWFETLSPQLWRHRNVMHIHYSALMA